MLVLSRKASEGIVIDGEIRIQVLKIRGNTIRLGIDAPDCTSIRRAELSPLASATVSDVEAAGTSPDRSEGATFELLN
jgi:carbon storage regulator CsrA